MENLYKRHSEEITAYTEKLNRVQTQLTLAQSALAELKEKVRCSNSLLKQMGCAKFSSRGFTPGAYNGYLQNVPNISGKNLSLTWKGLVF